MPWLCNVPSLPYFQSTSFPSEDEDDAKEGDTGDVEEEDDGEGELVEIWVEIGWDEVGDDDGAWDAGS